MDIIQEANFLNIRSTFLALWVTITNKIVEENWIFLFNFVNRYYMNNYLIEIKLLYWAAMLDKWVFYWYQKIKFRKILLCIRNRVCKATKFEESKLFPPTSFSWIMTSLQSRVFIAIKVLYPYPANPVPTAHLKCPQRNPKG